MTILRALWNLVLGAVVVLLCLYPILWLVLVSFQPEGGAWSLPPRWIFAPVLDNYETLFADGKFLVGLINSVQIAVITTLLCIVLGSFAGFALSRMNSPRAGLYVGGIALTRLFPPFAVAIPTFLMFRQIGILDTVTGLVLALTAANLPLAIVVMFSVFNGISPSLDEAARLDGAGSLKVLFAILLPLARPGIVSSAVLTFILVWNEFLFVLVLAGNRLLTVPILIANFQADRQILWGMIAAASAITLIPIAIFIALAQRQLLSGITAGAVRE